ncbi:MAG: hypothetical protein ACM3SW_16940 [Actinomycetota bacterium]
MQVLGNGAGEAGVCKLDEEQYMFSAGEAKWFVLWACVWILALALLFPALI